MFFEESNKLVFIDVTEERITIDIDKILKDY
jgi:hypothetical protein